MHIITLELFTKKFIRRREACFLLLGLMVLSALLWPPQEALFAELTPAVSVSADAQAMVEVGQPVRYTVTATNDGYWEAQELVITHTLPVDFTYEAGSTIVEQNGELISTADPLVHGQSLTWGPFTLVRAAATFDTPYGIHTFVQDLPDETYIDLQLDKALELAGLGGYVTQLLYPVTVSTTGPDPAWIHFVNGAYDRYLTPVLRIQGEWGGDYWLKPEADGPGDYASIAEAYQRVVEGLPRRDGHKLYVEIWNEPNLRLEWGGEVNPYEYASFMVDVSAAIREIGDPRIVVLNGALAPGGNYDNLAFIDAMATVPGAMQAFDVWASHSYPGNHPPQYNLHNGYMSRFTIDSYLWEVQRLSRKGRSGVHVMLTETGYDLGNRLFPRFPRINETNRAAYISKAFRDYWLSWPEVVGVTPFELVDPYGDWAHWDWLYPTTDEPHKQFTAVQGLPKPDPLKVEAAEMVMGFRAGATNDPGTYYSDISATAGNTTISPLTGVAPVMVVSKLHRRYLPFAARTAPSGASVFEYDVRAEDAGTMEALLTQLEASLPEPVPTQGSVRALGAPERPWEAPVEVASVSLGAELRGIALDPSRQRVYISAADGTLRVIDAADNRVLSTVPVGLEPEGVAVHPSTGLVYVANSGEGTVSVVEGGSYGLIQTIDGLRRPSGLAIDEVAHRIYVSDYEAGCVVIVDAESNAIVGRVPVGSHPYAIAVASAADRLYVASSGDGALTVLEASSLELVSSTRVSQPPVLGMALDREKGMVYLVHLISPRRRAIAVVDGLRGEVVTTLAGGWERPLDSAYAVALDEERGRLYIAGGRELLVVDTESQVLTASTHMETVTYNSGLAVNPTNQTVYVLDSPGGRLLILKH